MLETRASWGYTRGAQPWTTLEPRLPLSRARLLLPLLLVLAACAGRRAALETGATQCNDGLDNDDDGYIDCRDPDCQVLAICSPTDGPIRLDGAHDGSPPTQDTGPGLDLKPPQPDLPPTSGFGSRCQFSTPGTPCPDGTSECVPGNYGSPGICTRACVQGGPCADAPAGTLAHCAYKVQWPTGPVWYCLFTCQNGEPCPHDTQCYFNSFCF